MGGANNICSDKTGTLTKNEMNVTNVYIGKDKVVKMETVGTGKEKIVQDYVWEDYFNSKTH